MKVGWIDGSAGASGDMLLGAIVDGGVPLALIQDHVDRFELGIALRSEAVSRAGLAATKIHVDVPETATVRHLPDIVALLDRLDGAVRQRSVATFERLARAEAQVHGTAIDDVHFHEVGALDSIADVVGVCVGFDALGLDELYCSTLSLGSGTTHGAHGPIPVPAPAVLAVLGGVAPIAAGPAPYESTTPTGAALLAEWVTSWATMPAMTLDTSGMGAGTKDTDVVANVCRLLVGECPTATSPTAKSATSAAMTSASASASGTAVGSAGAVVEDDAAEVMIQFDANIDDLDPRVWPEAIAAVMRAGAVDAWVTPIIMKKGRPAHTFSALCPADDADAVGTEIFTQTSTIGLRRHAVERDVLERSESTVDVRGHSIGVKVARLHGEVVNVSVEWDDVVAAAEAMGVPANDVARDAHRSL